MTEWGTIVAQYNETYATPFITGWSLKNPAIQPIVCVCVWKLGRNSKSMGFPKPFLQKAYIFCINLKHVHIGEIFLNDINKPLLEAL